MKILLQNKVTRKYIQGPRTWTRAFEKANDFKTSVRALEFYRLYKLENVQVVMKFDDLQADVLLPCR